MILTLMTILALADPAAPQVAADAPAGPTAAADAALDRVTVQLRCTVRATGLVEDCAVTSESRPGLGFGEAALALMEGARAEPAYRAGRPIETRIDHQIDFTP